MENFTVLLWSAVITALAFFVVTPCVMNTVSLFGVQKRFARQMIGLGILKEADFRALHPKKTAAGVVISLILLGALTSFALRQAPYGLYCMLFGLAAGTAKYYRVLQLNSLTVKRFRNTYQNVMDSKKFNAYVEKNF